jgi:hypothetical protein
MTYQLPFNDEQLKYVKIQFPNLKIVETTPNYKWVEIEIKTGDDLSSMFFAGAYYANHYQPKN